MTYIYSDEILKEFVRLSEQQKPLDAVTIDNAQFDLLSNIADEIVTEGPTVYTTMAIVTASDTEAEILEKKYPMEIRDMIEEAHPESVMVADHPYGGGVVENQNEQHRKILNVVNKMPTGFPLHSWSALTVELTKIAQDCDDLGLVVEAAELDQLVHDLIKIKKNAGLWDIIKDLGKGSVGVAAWLSRLAVAHPLAAGVAAGVAASIGAFWTLWDGIREDMAADIQDLIAKLQDYNSDPDFTNVPGLKQMLAAANQLQPVYKNLLGALADRAGASSPENLARVADAYTQLGKQIEILKTNYPLFEASAPKNVARKLVGFENIKGRIDDLASSYQDLGNAANTSSVTESSEHNKSTTPGESGPVSKSVNVVDIKKFLKEHDLSPIVGYKYNVDDSAELDEVTRRVLSDLGKAIRSHLGTATPSTQELMNSSYDGLEKIMQIYREPWNFYNK